MYPALVASATVGYRSAAERASTSCSASCWRWATVSALSGPNSAFSSRFVRRPMAVGWVVVVTAGRAGFVTGGASVFTAAGCDDEDEQEAVSTAVAKTTANPKRPWFRIATSLTPFRRGGQGV